jgi:hypothetical protein
MVERELDRVLASASLEAVNREPSRSAAFFRRINPIRDVPYNLGSWGGVGATFGALYHIQLVITRR